MLNHFRIQVLNKDFGSNIEQIRFLSQFDIQELKQFQVQVLNKSIFSSNFEQ